MEKGLTSALFSCILVTLFLSSTTNAQTTTSTCSSYNSFRNNKQYTTCTDLPVLNSFVHWTYHSSNNTVDLAFRHTGASSTRWAAWALNPDGQRMAGSQCLVAFQDSTGAMRAYTSPIGPTGIPTLQQGPLSFGVQNLTATLVGSEITISATLQLTSNLLSTNQVWQEGPLSGANPTSHTLSGNNVLSIGTIDFRTGATTSGGAGGAISSRLKRRNTHGVLNAVSWGTLMPMGAMLARYLRVFKSANPAWFYIHIACQTSAYAIGVAGWATGLKLGSENTVTQYTTHRNIGITLFCLGTLQLFALLLRPKPDHKYRLYWNIYHQSVGYTVIILSIVNVFKGLTILDPAEKWRWIYIGILIFLGATAVLLEAITWVIVIKRKKENSQKQHHHLNGTNGFGARGQEGV